MSCWNYDSNDLALIRQPHGSGTFPVGVSDIERFGFVGETTMLSDLWVDVGVM
jgi:hypothetical protein